MRRKAIRPKIRTVREAAYLLLQVLIVYALCSALLFPHLHVVYPTAHDVHTCPIYFAVIVGAVIAAAAFLLMAALRVVGRSCCGEAVGADRDVPIPWHSRAPPV